MRFVSAARASLASHFSEGTTVDSTSKFQLNQLIWVGGRAMPCRWPCILIALILFVQGLSGRKKAMIAGRPCLLQVLECCTLSSTLLQSILRHVAILILAGADLWGDPHQIILQGFHAYYRADLLCFKLLLSVKSLHGTSVPLLGATSLLAFIHVRMKHGAWASCGLHALGLGVLHVLPRVASVVKELGKDLKLWREVVQRNPRLLLQLHMVIEAVCNSTTRGLLLAMAWWPWMATDWVYLLLLEAQVLILVQDVLEELLWVSMSASVGVWQICFESFARVWMRERGIFESWHRIEAVRALTWTCLIFYDTAEVRLAFMNIIVIRICDAR